MEKFVEKTLLYDFYSELLTPHQREIYENVVLNDYSISEVAQDMGISRQGVHDQIRRVDRLLAGYEDKLMLITRFMQMREQVSRIRELASEGDADRDTVREILEISDRILEEL